MGRRGGGEEARNDKRKEETRKLSHISTHNPPRLLPRKELPIPTLLKPEFPLRLPINRANITLHAWFTECYAHEYILIKSVGVESREAAEEGTAPVVGDADDRVSEGVVVEDTDDTGGHGTAYV